MEICGCESQEMQAEGEESVLKNSLANHGQLMFTQKDSIHCLLCFQLPVLQSKSLFEGTLYNLMMNEKSVSISLTPAFVRENLDALFLLSLA